MMAGDSYPNFETLCRLCLQPGTATVDIFSNNSASASKQLSIPVRIMACAALEVLPTDGLPKTVCTECRYQLEKSYYFRKRCQLSDKKLKKHQRLLSLGKKSRVFSRTEEEDFEDELEFEDSQNFLKEKDSERQVEEQKKNDCWKAWTKEMLREEVIDTYRQQLMAECKDQLRTEVEDELMDEMRISVQEEVRRQLRNEVREEVKLELHEEVTQNVRESINLELREKCTEQAKAELRDELKEECREEEREHLLNELKDYLSLKRSSNLKYNEQAAAKSVKADDVVVAVYSHEEQQKTSVPSFGNTKKRLTDSPPPLHEAQKLKLDIEKDSNSSDNEITSTEQTISFVAMTNGGDQANEASDSNFFILENEEREDDQEGNILFSYSDEDDFQVTPSECSADNGSATYQIEANGDVKFFKKELGRETENSDEATGSGDGVGDHQRRYSFVEEDIDKSVLIFDPDDEQENSLEKVEFVELRRKSALRSIEKAKTLGGRNINAVTLFGKDSHTSAKQNCARVVLTKDIKTFQCSECPRAFTTENSMLRHMAMHRILEKKGVVYKCSDCQIIVSCKSALNRHMLKHSGERPYVCEECGKSFIQREILKRHILAHSGARPYGCPHCERSFSQKLYLTQHVNKFHTENPKIQQYTCHLCPKRFSHASGLSRHLASHSGVAFQCTECERTFTDRSSVKRHIVHVHGGKGIDRIESISTNGEGKEVGETL